jgi:hypothetical protein
MHGRFEWQCRTAVLGHKSNKGEVLAKKIEVFSAGCSTCKETIEMVKRLAGKQEVIIHDMHKPEIAAKANSYGVRSLPALWSMADLLLVAQGADPRKIS